MRGNIFWINQSTGSLMAKRTARANSTLQRCELTQDPAKRAAANALTDSIKDDLPAGLSRPALRALASAGITRTAHFKKITEAELKQLHGMGPKAIEVIRQTLSDAGIAFRK
jgi:hypothetical protein